MILELNKELTTSTQSDIISTNQYWYL